MADEDAAGASVATPAPISTRKHMSLANEGHAIVRGVVHDVVEAAADQVYLNVLDRSYLVSETLVVVSRLEPCVFTHIVLGVRA